MTEFVYGCRRVEIAPLRLTDDGNPLENAIFDEPQLEVIGDGLLKEEKSKANHGNPDFKPTRKQALSKRF